MSYDNWKKINLSGIVASVSTSFNFNRDKLVLVNTSDVLEGKVLNHTFAKNEKIKGQFKKSFKKDDILYSEIRPKNKRFAYIDFNPEGYVASTKLMVLRGESNKVDNKFLYQILTSTEMINKLQQIAESRSGTFPQITFTQLGEQEVNLPPLAEQKAIANILSSLDDKIELNNKINTNLEEMAQALYKQWFVDFEFPNENGEPYKSSGGEMIESELGLIPKGWEVGTIDDVGFIIGGGTPSRKIDKYFCVNGIPWITPKDLSLNSDIFISKGQQDITEIGLLKSSAKLMPKGTVLYSSRAPIGYMAITQNDVSTNQGFKSIIPNQKFGTYFTYHLLKMITPNIESVATGSTFKEISGGALKSISIIKPKSKVISLFNDFASSSYSKIEKIENEIRVFRNLRDTLLPKLMSGEIEVPIKE